MRRRLVTAAPAAQPKVKFASPAAEGVEVAKPRFLTPELQAKLAREQEEAARRAAATSDGIEVGLCIGPSGSGLVSFVITQRAAPLFAPFQSSLSCYVQRRSSRRAQSYSSHLGEERQNGGHRRT